MSSFPFVIVLISTILFVGGCAKKPEEKQLKKKDKNITVQLEGSVYPAHAQTMIVGETTGIVNKIYKKAGDYVHKGEVIFSLDASDLIRKKQTVEKKIALRQEDLRVYESLISETSPKTYKSIALQQLEKVARLYAENYVSEKELNDARKLYADALYDFAQKSYDKNKQKSAVAKDLAELYYEKAKLERMIKNANYTSPIDGFIQKLEIEIGSAVRTNDKVGRIIDLDTVVIRAGLAAGLYPFVKVGDKVRIDFVTTPTFRVRSTIQKISPVLNSDVGGMVIEIPVPNQNYILQEKTGALITIYLTKEQQEFVKKYFWGRHTSWMKTVHIKSNE